MPITDTVFCPLWPTGEKAYDSDDSDLAEDANDVDENDFYDDIQLDEENRKALEMFQNT